MFNNKKIKELEKQIILLKLDFRQLRQYHKNSIKELEEKLNKLIK
jgi:hypothetical protein